MALRICRDLVVTLRLKLRSIGVPIDGPTNVLCDNNGVVKNTSIPTSTLAKKHNAINITLYVSSLIRVGKEQSESNKAVKSCKIISERLAYCMDLLRKLP